MLLFISQIAEIADRYIAFQYISCYCLSAKKKSPYSYALYFNTSHVTVYQEPEKICTTVWQFQYISCYCLSPSIGMSKHISCISIHLMLLFIGTNLVKKFNDMSFQYISCYCLSFTIASCYFFWIDFNTSHVTVYPISGFLNAMSIIISIHLMLLFIPLFHCALRYHYIFQYISCYCLSRPSEWYVYIWSRFQYISCYCLSEKKHEWERIKSISIHLMLLFI